MIVYASHSDNRKGHLIDATHPFRTFCGMRVLSKVEKNPIGIDCPLCKRQISSTIRR